MQSNETTSNESNPHRLFFCLSMVCRAIWNRKRKSNIEQRWIQLIFYVWMHTIPRQLVKTTQINCTVYLCTTKLVQCIRMHQRTQPISFPLVIKWIVAFLCSPCLVANCTCCTIGRRWCSELIILAFTRYVHSSIIIHTILSRMNFNSVKIIIIRRQFRT